jgi:hypothetical protein
MRVPARVKEELARRGHRLVPPDRPMFGFGGAQLIHKFRRWLLRRLGPPEGRLRLGF